MRVLLLLMACMLGVPSLYANIPVLAEYCEAKQDAAKVDVGDLSHFYGPDFVDYAVFQQRIEIKSAFEAHGDISGCFPPIPDVSYIPLPPAPTHKVVCRPNKASTDRDEESFASQIFGDTVYDRMMLQKDKLYAEAKKVRNNLHFSLLYNRLARKSYNIIFPALAKQSFYMHELNNGYEIRMRIRDYRTDQGYVKNKPYTDTRVILCRFVARDHTKLARR